MNKVYYLALTVFCLSAFSPAAYAKEKTEEGVFQKIKNAVVKVFTGEDHESSKNTGNQNALNQIDKNLEKHGGSHKGLENAHAAVSKSKKGGDYDHGHDSVIDEIADDVEEAIEDASDEVFGTDRNDHKKSNHFSEDHPGHGKAKKHKN